MFAKADARRDRDIGLFDKKLGKLQTCQALEAFRQRHQANMEVAQKSSNRRGQNSRPSHLGAFCK